MGPRRLQLLVRRWRGPSSRIPRILRRLDGNVGVVVAETGRSRASHGAVGARVRGTRRQRSPAGARRRSSSRLAMLLRASSGRCDRTLWAVEVGFELAQSHRPPCRGREVESPRCSTTCSPFPVSEFSTSFAPAPDACGDSRCFPVHAVAGDEESWVVTISENPILASDKQRGITPTVEVVCIRVTEWR